MILEDVLETKGVGLGTLLSLSPAQSRLPNQMPFSQSVGCAVLEAAPVGTEGVSSLRLRKER